MTKINLAGWGNYPFIEAETYSPSYLSEVPKNFSDLKEIIPRGLGRSYGDSSLAENILITKRLNHILNFNSETGEINCEAGASLKDICDHFIPKGWFLPVTPGTKFITVGGGIASDVHGKNHHKDGSFSDHIISFDLLLPNGETITCSHDNNIELFRSTCGGMGLTGIILRANFKLLPIQSSYIDQITVKAKNIEHIIDLFEEYEKYRYSVAWIDCLSKGNDLGRSILTIGDFIDNSNPLFNIIGKNKLTVTDKKIDIPLMFPDFALNKVSIYAFNILYYNMAFKSKFKTVVSYDKFFYPLDAFYNWNRIYGKRGFLQYQFVIPKSAGKKGMRDILERISNNGLGSFLAVLKLFGKGNENYLSFPMEGYTLALDFPISQELFKFLDELDKVVIDYGGRFYLTKDTRMKKDTFYKGYKDLSKFSEIRSNYDPERKFNSLQSKRLEL